MENNVPAGKLFVIVFIHLGLSELVSVEEMVGGIVDEIGKSVTVSATAFLVGISSGRDLCYIIKFGILCYISVLGKSKGFLERISVIYRLIMSGNSCLISLYGHDTGILGSISCSLSLFISCKSFIGRIVDSEN